MADVYGAAPAGLDGDFYGGHPFGVLAEELPTDGLNGPGYLYACVSLPADTGKRVRGPITRWPPGGTLTVYPDSAFDYVGTDDYAEFRLYVDGSASVDDIGYGPGVGRILLGVGSEATLTGGVVLGGVDVGGQLDGGVASQLGGAVQLDPADVGGSLSGGNASLLGGDVVLADVAASGVVGGVALPVALAGYTVEAKPRRASKPKALDVKDPDESIFVLFDFRLIAASVAGAQVRITRFSGAADEDPDAIAGGPLLVDGPRVYRRLDAGVDGCTYHLECQVDAPDGSRYVLAALLPVRSV